jgi:flagellar M-ring protein FliF
MQPLTKLELTQVKTIQHLVSKAVPKLLVDNVFVTDTAGRDYTEEMAKLDPKNLNGTDLSSRQLEIKKRYEKDLQHKIQTQLDQILGNEQAVVRVDTKWDFSQVETNAEAYTPSVGQQGGILLSEKYKNETYNGRFAGDGGTPGNNPNVDPSYQQTAENGAGTYNNNEGTRNFNTNKEVQRRIKEPAVLRDTTVSVAYNVPRPLRPPAGQMLDPRAVNVQKYSDEIGKMVGLAAGIEDYRNKVAVNPMIFNNAAAMADARAATDAAYWKWVKDMATLGVALLLGLLSAFYFFMSFRRRRREEQQELEEALPRLPSDDLGITIITDEPELQGVVAEGSALSSLPPPSQDEQRLMEMQRELANFIKGQPKDAVKLVRAWMTEDE